MKQIQNQCRNTSSKLYETTSKYGNKLTVFCFNFFSRTFLIGLFQKKKTEGVERGVEDMEFPGVLKNSMRNFQGLIEKEVDFPGVIKKKMMWSFQGSWFLALNF